MATLWIYNAGQSRECPLEDEPITIGRAVGNTIRLDDRTVSKKHARILKDQIGWRVDDLGSSNGTFLDGREIQSAHLVSGVRLKIGATEFVLDDTQMALDSEDEFEGMGTILTSIPAIPAGFLKDLEDESTREEGDSMSLRSGSSKVVSMAKKESIEERKLRLIREVGEIVIGLNETTAVAHEILKQMMEETKADRGFLCQYRIDGSHYPLASCGVREGESVRFSRTVLQKMLKEQSGVLIRQTNPGGDAGISSLKILNVHSTLCIPLWTRERIMGFVSLDMTQSQRGFTRTQLDVLVAVSHQAALGLERARFAEAVEFERKRRDYLCQYLDHKIIQSVLDNESNDDPLEARERVITVMFCDIVSFTKMSERMPPAELASFVRDHLTAMTEIIFSHDGTIDKYIGDAVMALFGTPVENPDAAINAVRAAMEMRKFVEQQVDQPLRLRFGIATGPVIVGNIGSAQRVEYTALGDTVNVASRLEGVARPGEIVIDESTQRQLGAEFSVEEIGTIDVKNRFESVQVFKVLVKPDIPMTNDQ